MWGTARITACCGWAPLLGINSGGAVDALTPVPVGPGAPVNATFAVEAGVTYRIAVDGAFDFGAGEAATQAKSPAVSRFRSCRPKTRHRLADGEEQGAHRLGGLAGFVFHLPK